MCVVYVSVTKGQSGEGCDLVSTLCKGDLFVLSWARVRRVRRWVYHGGHKLQCKLC